MKLYYSATSPFARKIRIAAQILKIEKQMELVLVDVYGAQAQEFKKINPLIKIPALEMQDGAVLTNSPFIMDYVNQFGHGHLISGQGPERWQQLNMQSQADGIIEAAVLRLYESRRSPHLFDSGFDQKQKIKIQNALRYFEDHVALMKSPNDSADWSVAEITLICALEYLDFRFSKDHFLSTLPRLREWQAKAQQNECIQKTRPA